MSLADTIATSLPILFAMIFPVIRLRWVGHITMKLITLIRYLTPPFLS
jgi:hypothetical protein